MANYISPPPYYILLKITTLLVLIVCLIPSLPQAQIAKKDSLEQILRQRDLPSDEKVFTLGRLATHYYFNNGNATADSLLNEALQLAGTLEDKQYLARTLALQAMQLRLQGDSSTNATLQSALDNLNESADPSIKGYVWYAKGWIEARDEQPAKAAESFITALQYYGNSGIPTDLITKSGILNELYSIYGMWKDLDNMEKYARMGLDNARKSGDAQALTTTLYSLGYTFEERYRENTKNKQSLDSAAYYYKQSVSSFIANESRISTRSQLPFNALGLANLYSEFYPLSYKDTAQSYLDIALEEGLKTKQYTVVASVYGILSEYAQREDRWGDAEHYLNQAAAYIKQEEIPDLATLIRIMESLAKIAEKKEDYQSALAYYKKYLTYYETRFDNEKMALGKELEVKYATELREQKLVMLEEQVAHRKKLNLIYILLSVTIFIALVFLFFAYRQRSKTLKQQQRLHQMELDNIKQEHKISLLSAMIDGQENERARIARDLHDGLGGLLSGIKIELSGGITLSATENTQKLIRNGLNRIDQAVDELRRISRNMMPEVLLRYGLDEALKEYSQSLKRSGVNITCQIFNYQNNLSKNKQVIVYRIAQELINNAIKYAESSHILVELRQGDDSLSLTVEDDGIGFDVQLARQKKGTGLQNIEARAVFLNGTLQINSTQEAGTSTVLNCPVS